MTTNYLALELTSRMEHEERLRHAAHLQRLYDLSQSAPQTSAKWFTSMRNFFSRHFVASQHSTTVTKPASMGLGTPTVASVASNRLMTEEEWLLLFRMVKSRKLSAEQAAQLLIAMS